MSSCEAAGRAALTVQRCTMYNVQCLPPAPGVRFSQEAPRELSGVTSAYTCANNLQGTRGKGGHEGGGGASFELYSKSIHDQQNTFAGRARRARARRASLLLSCSLSLSLSLSVSFHGSFDAFVCVCVCVAAFFLLRSSSSSSSSFSLLLLFVSWAQSRSSFISHLPLSPSYPSVCRAVHTLGPEAPVDVTEEGVEAELLEGVLRAAHDPALLLLELGLEGRVLIV